MPPIRRQARDIVTLVRRHAAEVEFVRRRSVRQFGDMWHEIGAAGEPAFGAGFSNLGDPHATAAFYLDPIGEVHFKGTIVCPTAASGQRIFTLPEGYRPASKTHRFCCLSGPNVALVDVVASTGFVELTQKTGSAANLSLTGVRFRAEV
jgi:hypothetical protein